MNVAQTILEQLGGRRFITMTGARDRVSVIEQSADVYNDQLRAEFTRLTGLYTSL